MSEKFSISAEAMAWAQRRRTLDPGQVFRALPPPPRVLPAGASTLAQDSAIEDAFTWAQGNLGLAFDEGLVFLGYPYLAALAQRGEYRRISETIASEMTREWIELKNIGDGDKTAEIKQLEDAMKRLECQDVFRRIAEQDGFFGRAHLYIDLGTTEDRDELKTSIGYGRDKTSEAKIGRGSLKALRPVEAVWCYPNNYNSSDPLSASWYRPQSWYVMGKEIHESRLLMFVGREVPDILKPVYAFGGLSLSQIAKTYVDNWLRTRDSVGALVTSFSTNGIKMNLAALLQREGEQSVYNRADFYNAVRDNRNVMLLDKDTEEFFNIATPLGGLSELQAQSQEHICSISGLPLIKYTGLTPTGLNASSEGELRSFYDWIAAYQEMLFRKALTRVIEFIQLSEFGRIDPDIVFNFKPLWQLDEAGKVAVQQTEAQIDELYEQMGAISNQEVRKKLVTDPESPYGGLDLDPEDMPEPPLPPGELGGAHSGEGARSTGAPQPGMVGRGPGQPGQTHRGGVSGTGTIRSPFGGGRDPFAGRSNGSGV